MSRLGEALTEGIKREHMPAVVTFFWRLVLFAFITWSIGTYGPIGIHGFAYATDAQRMEKTQSQQTDQLNEILRLQIAQELRRRQVDYCAAPPQSDRRGAIAADMERLQERYAELAKGARYVLPACADL